MDETGDQGGDRTGDRGRAALVEGDVEFDAQDASLLRAVARTGSVARASSELGRSRARVLSRIETLEAAFGDLVERQRGGVGGGGSKLTDEGAELLDHYDRLEATLTATAGVPETVLAGTVEDVAGELADVDTEIGSVRGLHNGLAAGDAVQVRIGADAVTIRDPDTEVSPDATSARNRRQGRISAVESGETVLTVRVEVEELPFQVLVTEDSAMRLDLREGRAVDVSWKATATRLVEKTRA